MRWLQAAMRTSERRWRLTNWLLLLLRCLAIAVICLLVAGPVLGLSGGGDRLVLVIDASASMGPRGDDPGPLAAARTALLAARLEHRSLALITVAGGAELAADGGPEQVRAALARIEARPLPGGLDSPGSAETVLAACTQACDVVLVSDFQQDRAEVLATRLKGRCRSLARWVVGEPVANARVAGVEAWGDPTPGQTGELILRVEGTARGASLAVDGGPFVALAAPAADITGLRIPLPPLSSGQHRIQVRIEDGSLAYDNLAELPLPVRPALPALVVGGRGNWLHAALAADRQGMTARTIDPARFGAEALPAGSLVALLHPVADSARLTDWVRGGGVLWAPLGLLRADPHLASLLEGLESGPEVGGGAWRSGEGDLDESFRQAGCARLPDLRPPEGSRVLLRAGTAPAVIALPAGRGWTVVQGVDLASDASFIARASTPLWVVRSVRRLAALADLPLQLMAGMASPDGLRLERAGRVLAPRAGQPLTAEPGLWSSDGRSCVVWPSTEEAGIGRPAPPEATRSLSAALPSRGGIDAGWLAALLAFVILLGEGALAAWAGRTYGR